MNAEHPQRPLAPQPQRLKGGTSMLPSTRPQSPVEIHYLHQAEPARLPASVLALETLGRMHPATAITLVLTAAGMAAGTVVAIVALVATVLATVAAIVGTVAIAGLGLAIAAIMLSGRAPTSR
jgi:hypothetical protein